MKRFLSLLVLATAFGASAFGDEFNTAHVRCFDGNGQLLFAGIVDKCTTEQSGAHTIVRGNNRQTGKVVFLNCDSISLEAQ